MSLIGLTPTLSTIRTLNAPMEVASTTNLSLPSSLTARNATSTTPATSTSGAESGLVIGASMNYAKVQVLTSGAATALVVHCIGWNRDRNGVWRPQQLAKVDVSGIAGTGHSVNGTTLFAYGTYAVDITSPVSQGNIKSFNSDHTGVFGGWMLVDLVGCELLDIRMSTSTSSITGNALVGFI